MTEEDDENVYHDDDFPEGLRCMDCGQLFVEGQPYSERLDCFIDDVPLVELVCVPCALPGKQ